MMTKSRVRKRSNDYIYCPYCIFEQDQARNKVSMIVAILYVVFLFFAAMHIKGAKDVRLGIGLVWLTLVWFFSFLIHSDSGFFASDELYYAANKIDLSDFKLNRSLWTAINMLVGISTEDVVLHMRCLNLLTVLLLYLYCAQSMKTIHPYFLAILLSYFSVVASLNLRDNFLIFSSLLLISRLKTIEISWSGVVGGARTLFWPALLVLSLRPLQFAFIVIAQLRLLLIIPIIGMTLVFLQTSYGQRYFYNYSYYTSNFDTAFSDKSGNVNLAETRPTIGNISYWSARFVLAPDPYSSVKRVFVDEEYAYGVFDLLIRAFHRIFYFSLVIFLLFSVVRYRWLLIGIVRDNHDLFKFAVIYTFVYSVFNSGGSHERIKMMIYVLVLLLFDYVNIELIRYRKKKFE